MVSRMLLFKSSIRLAGAVAACVLMTAATVAAQSDNPVADWQRRLGPVEARLRHLPAADTVAQERLAGDLLKLRRELSVFLATFPPAQGDAKAWLEEESGTASDMTAIAAEVGRLRAVLSRIAATGAGGEGGAFYLGRVDVAVTADTTAAATTEMTPAGASVLTAADLQANDRGALAGALSLAPGVTFTRIGQRNETAVYVRGYDMRQVPLFVDGIPIYTPYDGYVDLERFTTYDIAELSVSKGFTSVLYGPNALGGAINIVSRRPSTPFQGQATAGYASGTSRTLAINAGSRLTSFYLQGGASYLDADTFPLADAVKATKNQPTGDRLNAYRQDAKFNVKLGWTPNGRDDYAVSYVGQRAEKGNPPYAGSDASVKVRYWQWPYWDKDSLYFVSNTHLGASNYNLTFGCRDGPPGSRRGGVAAECVRHVLLGRGGVSRGGPDRAAVGALYVLRSVRVHRPTSGITLCSSHPVAFPISRSRCCVSSSWRSRRCTRRTRGMRTTRT